MRRDSPYQIAEVYACRDEATKAFSWLYTAYREKDPGLNQLKVDPVLNALRSDSRYTALLEKCGCLSEVDRDACE